MEPFVLVGKAKQVFRTIELAAKRATTIMQSCSYSSTMCSNPSNCELCPVRRGRLSELVNTYHNETNKLDIPNLTFVPVEVLAICPAAGNCDKKDICAHAVPHNPICGKWDCRVQTSSCINYTGHCETYHKPEPRD